MKYVQVPLMARGWQTTKIVAAWFVGLAAFTLLLMYAGQPIKILRVASESMLPTLAVDDAVIVQRVSVLDVQRGDLVSYRTADGLTITHRVLSVDVLTGRLIVKGDANATADPAINGSQLTGKVVATLGGFGWYIAKLNSWLGLLLFVYIPAAIVLSSEIRRMVRYYLHPTYVLPRYRQLFQ